MTILKKQHPFLSLIRENILAVLFFLFLVLVIWIGLENLSTSTQSEQLIATEQAVRRAAVQCYALEGSYPSDLTYLEQHYGLMLNHDRYVVHYQSLGGTFEKCALMAKHALTRNLEEESPVSNLLSEEASS